MGGHTAGDFASTAVVTRLAEQVTVDFVGEDALTEALRSAVDDMGRGVGHTDLGTGTTVTGIALTLVDGAPYWLVFNIGDSRVYSYRDGTLEQLTLDHSIVQELLDAGAITPAEAEVHPHSNVITRAVGFNEDPVPDYFLLPIVAGSRLLVCSDGLTKELTEHGIRHFLGEGSSPLDAAQQLMDAALGNGGRDNVTVVVVDVLATPESGAHREGVVAPRRPPALTPDVMPPELGVSSCPQWAGSGRRRALPRIGERAAYNWCRRLLRPRERSICGCTSRTGGDMARRLPSQPPNLPGFSYVRVLGSGGFADVFLYEQNMPRRQVAVKVMLAEVVTSQVKQMFQAEANLMAQLSTHPSILTVYQASVSADGRPYLVMELCSAAIGQRYRTEPLSGARGAEHRRAHRQRRRDGAPRRRAAPRHQALQHPDHRVRASGAQRLRHRRDARRGRRDRGDRPLHPVVGARGAARRDAAARSRARSGRSARRSTRCSPGGRRSRCRARRTPPPS